MYIEPTSDIFFTYLLGRPESKDLLLSFINAVFADSDFPTIKEAKIQNPFPLCLTRVSVLDVEAQDEKGRLYDIAIQNTEEQETADLSLCYWAKMYASRFEKGKSYQTLKPLIYISLLDFVRFNPPVKGHSCFLLFEKNGRRDEILTDQLQIHYCEIPKFEDRKKGPLKNWLKYFFIEGKAYRKNDMQILLQEEPILQKAHQVYEDFSQNDELTSLYRAIEKGQRDIATRLDDAKQAGIKQGKRELAKKMKAQGLDVQMIQDSTGLPAQEIDEL